MTERDRARDVYTPPESMALARRLVDHRLRMELNLWQTAAAIVRHMDRALGLRAPTAQAAAPGSEED